MAVWTIQTWTGLFAAFALVGCDSEVEIEKSESEQVFSIRHSEENWQQWTAVVDAGLKREAAGDPAPQAYSSWTDRWMYSICQLHNPEVQENHEKYVEYLRQSRDTLGLPKLPRYSKDACSHALGKH